MHRGYVKLYRKISESWQWSHPLWRGAWVWMLLEARAKDCPDKGLLRGQLWFSITWSKKLLNMTQDQARYFLNKCVTEGDISWQRGEGYRGKYTVGIPARSPARNTGHSPGHSPARYGLITLLNYDQYNTNGEASPDHNPTHSTGRRTVGIPGLPKECIKKEKNEEQEPPLPPHGGTGKKRGALKDPVKLQEELAAINIAEFIRIYEPQGLDVIACFDDFSDYVLKGSAKKPTPNPSNWIDFSRAFHDSCKRSLRQTSYPKNPVRSEDDWKV